MRFYEIMIIWQTVPLTKLVWLLCFLEHPNADALDGDRYIKIKTWKKSQKYIIRIYSDLRINRNGFFFSRQGGPTLGGLKLHLRPCKDCCAVAKRICPLQSNWRRGSDQRTQIASIAKLALFTTRPFWIDCVDVKRWLKTDPSVHDS